MTAYALGRTVGDELRYGADDSPSYQQFLGRLLEFIPGDVVAGYVVILGLLPASSSSTAEWTTAIVFAVLAPLIVILGSSTLGSRVFFRAAAAFVAFGVWVLALPGSPITGADGWLRSLVLVVVTILLTVIDQRLETRP